MPEEAKRDNVVSANIPSENLSVEVTYDFGDGLEDLIDLCSAGEQDGGKVVFLNAVQNMTVTLQSLLRRHLKGGKSQEEIQALVDEWTPGAVSRTRKSAPAKAATLIDNMNDDDLQKTLQLIKERKEALAKGQAA